MHPIVAFSAHEPEASSTFSWVRAPDADQWYGSHPFVASDRVPHISVTAAEDASALRALSRALDQATSLSRYLSVPAVSNPPEVMHFATGGQPSGPMMTNITLHGHTAFVAFRGLRGLRSAGPASRRLTIATGLCLFSGSSLWSSDADGMRLPFAEVLGEASSLPDKVRRIEHDPLLSLYELESVESLSRMIAAVINSLPAGATSTVLMQVPRVEYYLYIVDAMRAGLLAPSVVQQWLELVDERHRMVAGRFTARLQELVSADQTLNVLMSPGLEPHEELVRSLLAEDALADQQRVVEVLLHALGAHSEAWRTAISIKRPRSVWDIIRLGYPLDMCSLIGSSTSVGTFMLIDNPREMKMFTELERLAREFGLERSGVTLTGLFPLGRTLILRNRRVASSYHRDPGQRLFDHDHALHTPESLLEILYPERSGANARYPLLGCPKPLAPQGFA